MLQKSIFCAIGGFPQQLRCPCRHRPRGGNAHTSRGWRELRELYGADKQDSAPVNNQYKEIEELRRQGVDSSVDAHNRSATYCKDTG
jgi:hypothetical protein